jgi:hypothetical protein
MNDTETDTAPDNQQADGAPIDAQTDQGTPEPDGQGNDEANDADDAQDDSGRRRGVRERLAEAEAERDALRETLTRQQQAVYSDAIGRAGVAGTLMAAAERGLESLVGDDGVIHPADVTAAADQVAAEAGIPRRPQPDPALGRGGDGSAVSTVTIGTLLRAAAKGE